MVKYSLTQEEGIIAHTINFSFDTNQNFINGNHAEKKGKQSGCILNKRL